MALHSITKDEDNGDSMKQLISRLFGFTTNTDNC